MDRIVVTGTPGSGKTTLARRLAQVIDAPHIKLEPLYWDAAWQPAPAEVFRQRVVQATQGARWIIDGLYHKSLTWTQADTLVWLDYPLLVVLCRLLRRETRQLRDGETPWGDNRPGWRRQLLSSVALFFSALTQHHQRRRRYLKKLVRQPAYAHLTVIRLRSPREAETWLKGLRRARCQSAQGQ
jgi:adenylate kinase family enzyme